ncbi:hypothetical protein FLLO111716_12720 [Flavobacterium longum]|uniref:hypothetical protein n=1 Tax=Flavobacterium longum TaxID=1299340 RepID=UPI0039ED3375
MFQSKLPGDPVVLVMGFISVGMILLLSDATYFLFVALFFSIAGLSKGADNLKLYEEQPELYYPSSKKNVADGRHICGFSMLASFVMLIIKGIMYLIH